MEMACAGVGVGGPYPHTQAHACVALIPTHHPSYTLLGFRVQRTLAGALASLVLILVASHFLVFKHCAAQGVAAARASGERTGAGR